MRSVGRTTALPPTLGIDGLGSKKAADHLRARACNPAAQLAFPDHWNQPDVRGVVYGIQGRVCAYCTCELPRNDRGDVDHFRGKKPVHGDPGHGGYWWIAYDLDNYFLSCSTCNSTHKGNKFPLRAGARRFTFADRAQLHDEARLLLDPSRDPVEQWLRVDYRRPLCPIEPAPGLSATAFEQVEETLRFFHINDDVLLVKDRIRYRDEALKQLARREFKRVRDHAMRFRPHSLVARQMLIDQNQPPPTPAEELNALISEILTDLDIALDLLQSGKAGAPLHMAGERFKTEVLWSLATIWRSPPVETLTSSQIERKLKRANVADYVKPLYEQL
jgi:uncharacterized protein (TIGR02646 family)